MAAGVGLAAVFFAFGAAAAEVTDTLYGRFDGDLAVAAGVGATFGPNEPRATVDLRLRYLASAGIFGTYEDGPVVSSDSEPRRVIATGLELRPLFLGRWGRGFETGKARLDLFIDSFALELGAAFVQPSGARFGARPGLQAGVGLEVPIFARASGPIVGLHGGVRWSAAALGSESVADANDRALYLNVVLGWQEIFGGHIASMGDSPR